MRPFTPFTPFTPFVSEPVTASYPLLYIRLNEATFPSATNIKSRNSLNAIWCSAESTKINAWLLYSPQLDRNSPPSRYCFSLYRCFWLGLLVYANTIPVSCHKPCYARPLKRYVPLKQWMSFPRLTIIIKTALSLSLSGLQSRLIYDIGAYTVLPATTITVYSGYRAWPAASDCYPFYQSELLLRSFLYWPILILPDPDCMSVYGWNRGVIANQFRNCRDITTT